MLEPTIEAKASRKRIALGLIGLIALTVSAYWGVARCGFIAFDDPDYVTQNPYVKTGLTLNTVKWAFTHFHSSNWHPLTWCSHMLDIELFGLQPAGHHLHNLVLHCLNVSLIFGLFGWLSRSYGKAFLLAALFAVHPLHVESVAWVAERKDMLSTFFGLLTLLAYARYARSSTLNSQPSTVLGFARSPAYWFAGLFFALGLLSKPMLVTLPCVMLLLDFWPLNRLPKPSAIFHLPSSKWLLMEKLPFFALAIASCVVTMRAQGTGRSVISLEWLPLEVRIGNSLAALFDYVARTFVPTKLAVFYPFPTEIPWAKATVAGLVLLFLFGLALRQIKTRPWLFVGLAWFVGTLVPVIGLVQVGMQASADRYSYIPHIGLFMAIVWGVFQLPDLARRARVAVGAGLVLVLGAATFLTQQQVRVWRNDETLFKHAKDVTTRNYIALTIYGRQLADQGKHEEALALYEQVLEIQPRYAGGYFVMADVYRKQGRTNDALAGFSDAIRLDPFHAEALNSRGALLTDLDRNDEARQDFLKAIEVLPSFEVPRLNLGIVLQRQGRLAEAAAMFKEYLKLDPKSAKVLTLLGDVEFRMGEYDKATKTYQEALKYEPKRSSTRYALACAHAATSRFADAEHMLSRLIAEDPSMPEAYFQLGVTLCALNQADQAITNLQKSVALKATNALYRYHLAVALSQAGRKAESIKTYEETLQLDKDFAEPLNNLAWLLATDPDAGIRNGSRAVELAERACELTKQKETLLIGTLAAAYAEAGRFDQAIAAAQRAIQTASTNGQTALASRNAELLEFYRAGKAFHEAQPGTK